MTLDEALAITTGETELPEDVIWYSVLDQTYIVTVRRIDEYHATYEIADKTGSPLHSEEVGLSYGALFGPDVGDVDRWQQDAIAFVDKQT